MVLAVSANCVAFEHLIALCEDSHFSRKVGILPSGAPKSTRVPKTCSQVPFVLGGWWLYCVCRQGQPFVVEARVPVDAEGQGGGAMMTVSLRPYHKGLPLAALSFSLLVLACSHPDARLDEIDTLPPRRKKPVGSSSEPYGRLNRTPRAIEAKPTGSCGKPVGLLERSSRAIWAKQSGY